MSRLIFWILVITAIEVVLVGAWLAHGELPEGMYRTNVIIDDTVVFRQVPSQRLDRLDSARL